MIRFNVELLFEAALECNMLQCEAPDNNRLEFRLGTAEHRVYDVELAAGLFRVVLAHVASAVDQMISGPRARPPDFGPEEIAAEEERLWREEPDLMETYGDRPPWKAKAMREAVAFEALMSRWTAANSPTYEVNPYGFDVVVPFSGAGGSAALLRVQTSNDMRRGLCLLIAREDNN